VDPVSPSSQPIQRKGRGLLIGGLVLAGVLLLGGFAAFAASQKDEPTLQGPALLQAYSTWRGSLVAPVRADDDHWLTIHTMPVEPKDRLEASADEARDRLKALQEQLGAVKPAFGFSVAQGIQLDQAQQAFQDLFKARADFYFHLAMAAKHSANPYFMDEVTADEAKASKAHDAAWDQLRALDQQFGFTGK